MNVQDALSVLSLGDRTNLDSEVIKIAYRKACAKYHPDRNPAGLEMMKMVNLAYEALQDILKDHTFIHNKNHEKNQADFGDVINTAIQAILGLHGLIIEVCGSWVWVTGDTKTHKNALKTAGFMYAPQKQQWYFRPTNKASYRKSGQWDMEKIRNTFGASTPEYPQYTAIQA